MEGLVSKALLEFLAFAYVPEVQDDALPRRVIEEAGGLRLEGAEGAVPAAKSQLLSGVSLRRAEREQQGVVRGVEPLGQLRTLKVAWLIAEHRCDGTSLVEDRSVGCDHRDHVGPVLDQRTHTLLALEQHGALDVRELAFAVGALAPAPRCCHSQE